MLHSQLLRRFLRPLPMLAVLALAGMVYVTMQWMVAEPVEVRVSRIVTREDGVRELDLELRNASWCVIHLRHAGPARYQPRLANEVPRLDTRGDLLKLGPVSMRPGEVITGMIRVAPNLPLDNLTGSLRYDWEPTPKIWLRNLYQSAAVRRLMSKLPRSWRHHFLFIEQSRVDAAEFPCRVMEHHEGNRTPRKSDKFSPHG